MRTLGIIGGMSWESTAVYYRLLNQGVVQRLGGLHSAQLRLHSLDFAPVAAAQAAGQWDALADQLGDAARGLVRAGAQGLLIATNTMHRLAASVELAAGVPLLHIADATGQALRAAGHRHVGLLGTCFTMEDGRVIRDRLVQRHGLSLCVPDAAGRAAVHAVIYDELCQGRIVPASRDLFSAQIEALAAQGAQAVILGCTEIGLLIGPQDSALPVFDSTLLHAAAAVNWMLQEETT